LLRRPWPPVGGAIGERTCMGGLDGRKRAARRSDVIVVTLARLLSQMRPWVLVGTFLAVCLAIYAVAWLLRVRR